MKYLKLYEHWTDDDDAAYKKLSGDSKKTKPSKYTKKFAQMFNENLSTLRDQVNSLPDSFHYATHITDGDTAEKIYNTQFKFNLGTGLSGTVGSTNKANLIHLLERLAKGDSPHGGYTGLFLLAFPKSEFGEISSSKKVNLDTIESDMLDNYDEFAGGKIPVKFNYGYFKDGILYTKNDSLKENLSPVFNSRSGEKLSL